MVLYFYLLDFPSSQQDVQDNRVSVNIYEPVKKRIRGGEPHKSVVLRLHFEVALNWPYKYRSTILTTHSFLLPLIKIIRSNASLSTIQDNLSLSDV